MESCRSRWVDLLVDEELSHASPLPVRVLCRVVPHPCGHHVPVNRAVEKREVAKELGDRGRTVTVTEQACCPRRGNSLDGRDKVDQRLLSLNVGVEGLLAVAGSRVSASQGTHPAIVVIRSSPGSVPTALGQRLEDRGGLLSLERGQGAAERLMDLAVVAGQGESTLQLAQPQDRAPPAVAADARRRR